MKLHSSIYRLAAVMLSKPVVSRLVGVQALPNGPINCFDHPCLHTRAVDLRMCSEEEIEKICEQPLDTSSAEISVLGTGGNELSPSFVLNCASRTYLFNHGEGWKRMIDNFRMHMPEDRISFFTRACWENMAGSCSVYHTQLLLNQQKQKYCGPRKTKYFMQFMERFVGTSTWVDVETPQPGQPGWFEDENIRVSIIDVDPLSDVLVGAGSVVALSCKLADWGGDFVVEKASELGVKTGAALRVLLSGRSVITETGNLVHQSQFVTSAKIGPIFVVVDCPTEEVMNALTGNQYLQPEWYSRSGEAVRLVVHITPLEILQNESYCKWMASFGEDTKHLFVHSSVCPGEVSYRAAMSFSLPFHLMNPSVYRLPCVPDQNIIHKTDLNVCKYINKDSITFARSLMKYDLKPSLKLDLSSCLPPIEEQVLKDLSRIKDDKKVYDSIIHHRQALCTSRELDDKALVSTLSAENRVVSTLTDPDDVQVTFLGTSSSQPTRIRSVSGILLQTLTSGNILLDCGEGTLCQLYRLFGRESAEEILRNLTTVFISHIHVDHHFGLIGVINQIQNLTRGDSNANCVNLLIHRDYNMVLKKYSVWCESIQFNDIDVKAAANLPFPVSDNITLQTVPVQHIKGSYGIVVRNSTAKWSIVYSGDTMPCEELIQAGQNASLLIHEATLADDQYELAKQQKHSTYREAVMVAKAMKARFTVMTHFGRRMTKYPLTMFAWPQQTAPAVDFMSFKLSDLHKQRLDSSSSRRVLKQIGVSPTVQNALAK